MHARRHNTSIFCIKMKATKYKLKVAKTRKNHLLLGLIVCGLFGLPYHLLRYSLHPPPLITISSNDAPNPLKTVLKYQ